MLCLYKEYYTLITIINQDTSDTDTVIVWFNCYLRPSATLNNDVRPSHGWINHKTYSHWAGCWGLIIIRMVINIKQ